MQGCRPFLDDEVKLIQHSLSIRDRCMFDIGIYTGFRVSELLSLRVKDVYDGKPLDRAHLQKKNTKGKKHGCKQLLNDKAKESINNYVNHLKKHGKFDPDAYLFASYYKNTNGKPLTRQRAWQIIRDTCKRLGINEDVATHSWRKYFAKKVLDNTNGDYFAVKEALRHQNINNTFRYLQSNQSKIEDAILNI